MDSVYEIGVKLSMDVAGLGSAAAVAMRLFGDLEGKAASAEASVAKLARGVNLPTNQFVAQSRAAGAYTAQIEAMTVAQNHAATAMGAMGKLAVGAGLIGVGVVGFDLMKGWATAAGQMQDALVQVGITASGTQAQLQGLFTQSFAVANATQYSGGAVLKMDQIMGRMGFRDPSGKQTQRQVIHDAIPDFARAAEITQHFSGTDYQETITALAQQAHMFSAYSGLALKQNVAWATGVGLVSHMTPSQEVNVLRYMAPAVKSGQISSLDAMSLAALGNQTGLTVGGKAASSIGTLLRELSPNGSARHDDALAAIEKLGGGNFYKSGKLIQPPAWLGILNRFYDATKGNQPLQTYLTKNGLLVQGAQAAAVFGNDTSIKQYTAIHSQLTKDTPAWAAATQGQLNMTLPGQLQTLSGNLGSIQGLLGTQLLPILVPAVHGFVELTSAVVDVLSHHQQVAQFAAAFTLVGSSAALAVGGVLAISGALQLASLAAAPLGIELLPITATIVGIGAAVAVVTYAVTHWSSIMGALTGKLGLTWQILGLGGVVLGSWTLGLKLAAVAQTAYTAVTTLMSGAVGLATTAFAALDLALSPITLTMIAVTASAAASVWVWQNWATVAGALSGKLGPVWSIVANLATTLDPALRAVVLVSSAFHQWDTIMAAIDGTIMSVVTDMAKLKTALPSLPSMLEKSALHLLPGGDLLAHQFGLGGGGGTSGPGGAGGPTIPTHVLAPRTGGMGGPTIPTHVLAPRTGATPPHLLAPRTGPRPVAGGAVNHTTHVHFHAGAIVAQPHQSTKDIAEAVWATIAEKAGQDSRRQGSSNIGWDLGYAGV